MEIFLLYLWTRLDIINLLSIIGLIVLIGIIVFSGISYSYNKDMLGYLDKCDVGMSTAKNLFKKTLPWISLPLLLILIVPSQKDAAIIAGGWLVKEISTSEKVNTIGQKTFDLINGKLNEQLEALKTPDTP